MSGMAAASGLTWLMYSFSAAFAKLLELGVPTAQFAGEPWSMGSQ